jgi:hypothetical protein
MLASTRLQRPAGLARPAGRGMAVAMAVARPSAPRPAAAAAPAGEAGGAAALPLAALAAAAPFLLDIPAALATGGDFGILEGRTAALVHPAVMIVLFGLTSYAGYLGWQWRRTRTIGDDIKALKAQLPKPAEGEAAPPPSPIATQVAALEKVRALRGRARVSRAPRAACARARAGGGATAGSGAAAAAAAGGSGTAAALRVPPGPAAGQLHPRRAGRPSARSPCLDTPLARARSGATPARRPSGHVGSHPAPAPPAPHAHCPRTPTLPRPPPPGAQGPDRGRLQGQALRRGRGAAGVWRRHRHRGLPQHLDAHGQALPGPPPVCWRGHRGAVGGRRRARALDAEGQRGGAQRAHRAQRAQPGALRVAGERARGRAATKGHAPCVSAAAPTARPAEQPRRARRPRSRTPRAPAPPAPLVQQVPTGFDIVNKVFQFTSWP